jgi:sterol desaturase/sphingolipid hydroxylase (fatty acid hydroxylase superfamily)
MLTDTLVSNFPRLGILLGIGAIFGLLEWRWPARPHKLGGSGQLKWDLAVIGVDRFAWVFLLQIWSLLVKRSIPDRPLFASVDPWVGGAMAILGIDFLRYWAHRLVHLPGLWRAHRWHHMPAMLYWLSGHRATFLHQFFIGALPLLLLTKLGLFDYALSDTVLDVVAVWMGLVQTHFEHANLNVGGRALELFLVTPRFHRIHHARSPELYQSNYGFGLTIWDRLFGTFKDPGKVGDAFEVGEEAPSFGEQMRALMGV